MATSPFPGIDPYVERFWNDAHGKLVTYIAVQLNEELPSRFRAELQDRVIIASVDEPPSGVRSPDVAVVETPFGPSAAPAAQSPHASVRALEIVRYRIEPLTQSSIEIIDLLREGHRFFEFPARLLKPERVKPYYVTMAGKDDCHKTAQNSQKIKRMRLAFSGFHCSLELFFRLLLLRVLCLFAAILSFRRAQGVRHGASSRVP